MQPRTDRRKFVSSLPSKFFLPLGARIGARMDALRARLAEENTRQQARHEWQSGLSRWRPRRR